MEVIYNDHQRINLSSLAQKVINQDRIISSAFRNEYTNNGFVNKILFMYLESSCEDFKLNDNLIKVPGISTEFRLNKDTLDSLDDFINTLSDKHPFHATFPKTTSFLKTILETYSRLPYIEREKLIHKEVFDKIIKAQHDNKKIHVFTYKETFDLTPYEIIPSKEGTFYYLIGFDDEEKIHAIRVSRIKNVKSFGKAQLPPEYKLVNTNEDLAEFGPTFVEDPVYDIVIQFLTEKAKQSYEYSVIHRPIHNEIVDEKKNIYKFRCSLRQAEFFFFRFAGEINILEPTELKDWFVDKYQSGLNALKEND